MTQDELKRYLRYDPETGEFVHLVARWNVVVGSRAGCMSHDGYWRITINQRSYYAHQLAWLYVHGVLPAMVDHRDLDPSNNRIDNLRPSSKATNGWNRGMPSNNTSGFKGVHFEKYTGRWLAFITANGKRKNLGRFETAELANEFRQLAVEMLHGEFAHGVNHG